MSQRASFTASVCWAGEQELVHSPCRYPAFANAQLRVLGESHGLSVNFGMNCKATAVLSHGRQEIRLPLSKGYPMIFLLDPNGVRLQ